MSMTRRKFLATTAAVATTAATFSASSYARILGANDKINLGFMGTRSRGEALLGSFTVTNHVTQQSGHPNLNQPENLFEATIISIVRIRHFIQPQLRREAHQQMKFVPVHNRR